MPADYCNEWVADHDKEGESGGGSLYCVEAPGHEGDHRSADGQTRAAVDAAR